MVVRELDGKPCATKIGTNCPAMGRIHHARGSKAGFMRYHRFWIEIVLLGSAAAVALALLFASLGAAAGAAANARDSSQLNPSVSTSFEGMLTCSRCGAKHSAALDRSASTCVRVCVHAGSSFVLVNSDTTYLLDGDLTVLKKLAGQRVRVTGTREGQIIKVVSAASEN